MGRWGARAVEGSPARALIKNAIGWQAGAHAVLGQLWRQPGPTLQAVESWEAVEYPFSKAL